MADKAILKLEEKKEKKEKQNKKVTTGMLCLGNSTWSVEENWTVGGKQMGTSL